MGKLAQYLKTEANHIRSEKSKRQAALREWHELLGGLFGQIDQWLESIDPDGLLERKTESIELNDPALGEYSAPARRIGLGDKWIEIVPTARYVAMTVRPPGVERSIKVHGLVEIRNPFGKGYYLFQVPSVGWYIQAEQGNLRVEDNPVRPLDLERFEEALASILR